MRVLAIGGSGGMGRHAVSLIQTFGSVLEIIVADLNESSANIFAEEMNSKVSAIGLDVNDTEAMCRAMRKADIVINTSGPFYRFGKPILQAAINEGCNYLDICDDWEPTIEMLKLDQAAKTAGVTAIVGLGASPGISNMLALIAMQELDEVSSVFTGWDLGGAKPEEESSQEGPNAAMIHGIEQMTGKVQIYRNGAVELVSSLAPVPIHYPGIPTFKGYIFGHPEAVTFPHNYPTLTQSINLAHGGDIDSILLKAILALVNWHSLHGSQVREKTKLQKGVRKHRPLCTDLPWELRALLMLWLAFLGSAKPLNLKVDMRWVWALRLVFH